MRRRNSGPRAIWTICRINSFPGSSAGGLCPRRGSEPAGRGVEDPFESDRVAQHQRCALVGGKPAAKANGQRLRIQRPRPRASTSETGATGSELPRSRRRENATRRSRRRSCVRHNSSGRNLLASRQRVCRGLLAPSRAEIAGQKSHLVRDPRLRVNAVGHMRDGDLVGGNSRPQIPPHRARIRAWRRLTPLTARWPCEWRARPC